MTTSVTGGQPGAAIPTAGRQATGGTTAAPATNAQAAATAAAAGQPAAGAQGGTAATSGVEDKKLDDAFKTQYNVAVPALPGQTTLTGGINILSKMYSIRSNRLADISLALANYTNATGQLNQAAVVKLQQENDANSNLNQLIKSLFDKQADAIRAWTQLR